MHLTKIAGIPLRLHWSFLALVAGFAVYALLRGGPGALFATGLLSAGLFGSVVLHELGHALAARRYGIETAHITLYPFGGIAAIQGQPEDPAEEVVIAIAGPAVNFALAALFGLLWAMSGGLLLTALIGMNLVMGLFNLIPAFPMDGGRVLRALLARRMGFVPASLLAIRIGRVFAWGFLAAGLLLPHVGLLLVAAFLHFALAAEKQQILRVIWERQRSGRTDWRDPRPFGQSAVYRPRWSISPR